MTTFNSNKPSKRELTELIGEIRGSMETGSIPLPPDQALELDRRYATLDEDIKQGRDALAVYKDLAARYR